MWSRAQLVDAVKYPFSTSTRDIVRWLAFDPDRLDPSLIERGKKRVAAAVQTGTADASTSFKSDKFLLTEILSYPIAKMLVAATKDKFFIRRYTLAEASSFKNNLSSEQPKRVFSLAEDLGVEVKGECVAFNVFVNNLCHDGQRLVNMPLKNGVVKLNRPALECLLAEVFRKKLSASLLSMEDVPHAIGVFATELKKEVSREQVMFRDIKFGPIEEGLFPPCAKYMMAMMGSGDPVGHQPRFVLATFLINIGSPVDKVIDAFRNTPNFNEKKARYFVEYSAGKRGSGTKYSVPSCEKMRAYGLCYNKDALCNKIKHPLSYYAAKKRGARLRRLSKKK